MSEHLFSFHKDCNREQITRNSTLVFVTQYENMNTGEPNLKGTGVPYALRFFLTPSTSQGDVMIGIRGKRSALESYGSQHLRTPFFFEIGQGVAKLEHSK